MSINEPINFCINISRITGQKSFIISNTVTLGKLVIKYPRKAEGGFVQVPRALARETFTNPHAV